MLSSSEIQRITLSASKYLRIKCQVNVASASDKEAAKSLDKASSDVAQSSEQETPVSVQIETNTTILSVDPETSFGDMTVDSIREHITYDKAFVTFMRLVILAFLYRANNDDSKSNITKISVEAPSPGKTCFTTNSIVF